jgi:hypothetical protein
VAPHLRLKTAKQVLCAKKIQDGDTTRSEVPNAEGDYMFGFDMQDGFYTLGINPAGRDYSVNERGHLYQLAGLSMGCFLFPFYSCEMTLTFINFLRSPDP